MDPPREVDCRGDPHPRLFSRTSADLRPGGRRRPPEGDGAGARGTPGCSSTAPDRFAAAIKAIAEANGGAVVVHCAAGKDRTGLVAALMLRLVPGVPHEEIVEDYVTSGRNLAPADRALDRGGAGPTTSAGARISPLGDTARSLRRSTMPSSPRWSGCHGSVEKGHLRSGGRPATRRSSASAARLLGRAVLADLRPDGVGQDVGRRGDRRPHPRRARLCRTRCRSTAACRSSRNQPERPTLVPRGDLARSTTRLPSASTSGSRRRRSTRCSLPARTPVVAGGTGLYLRAALTQPGELPPPPRAPRAGGRWEEFYDSHGAVHAHGRLPGGRSGRPRPPWLPPTHRRRVVRALELAEAGSSLAGGNASGTGSTGAIDGSLRARGSAGRARAAHRAADAPAMFEAGVEDEVRQAPSRARSPTTARQMLPASTRSRPARAPRTRSRRWSCPHAPLRRVPAEVAAPDSRGG